MHFLSIFSIAFFSFISCSNCSPFIYIHIYLRSLFSCLFLIYSRPLSSLVSFLFCFIRSILKFKDDLLYPSFLLICTFSQRCVYFTNKQHLVKSARKAHRAYRQGLSPPSRRLPFVSSTTKLTLYHVLAHLLQPFCRYRRVWAPQL
jgi:hypothetical protein